MWKRSLSANKKTAFLLILLLFLCTACTGSRTNRSDGITFTDALGRTVCVPQNPERVAALIGSFADVWQLAGGTVCASADDAWDDFGLEMGDAVNLGKTKEPNLEKLLASDPDFVIASASTAADVEMKDILDSAGIPTAYFDVVAFDDYLNMLNICTDITGRKDLYEENGLKVQEQIEAIKKEMGAIPEAQKTVLFLRASSGYIRAKNSEGSILGEMLKELGCINIADDDQSLLENLSIERIIQNEPYRIFIVQVGDDEQGMKENVSKMMAENPAWRELRAVKENRLYYMDKRLFNLKPNARWGEAYEILCKLLQE